MSPLALTPHVVYGRARLLQEVWGYRQGAGERTVDSHIRGLRRKLGADVIRTVHGIGYAFSRNFQLDVVQDLATSLHQKTGLEAGDDSSARISVTRLVARVALGG